MTTGYPVTILGTGSYLPERVVTNADLEKLMDTSDEWIRQRSGIRERRFAAPDEGPAELAVKACENALAAANKTVGDIDLLITATLTPDYYFPGTAAFVQDMLGMGTTPALDVRNQCSGFLYALATAKAFVASGQYNNVLIACAEVHSRALDMSDAGRDVSVLFGDGAGAVVVARGDDAERGVLSSHLHMDGSGRDLLKIETPSTRRDEMFGKDSVDSRRHFPYMEGRQVFKNAVRRLPEVVAEALAAHSLKPADVDTFLFHQANLRINEAVLGAMEQPAEKTVNNIDRYGNTSSASLPILLDEVVRSGRVQSGQYVVMAAFGAGFTWGSAVLRWP